MKIFKDIKSLTMCGGFGAIAFVLMWGLGAILLMATGLPLVGGLVSSIASSFVLMIGVLLIERTGAASIITATIGFLTVPTVILGPPGLYKIPLMLSLGILFEILVYFSQKREFLYPLFAAIAFAISVPMEFLIFKYLGFPAAEKLQKMLLLVSAIYFINAYVGSWLGAKFYINKIQKLQAVQSWNSNRF